MQHSGIKKGNGTVINVVKLLLQYLSQQKGPISFHVLNFCPKKNSLQDSN